MPFAEMNVMWGHWVMWNQSDADTPTFSLVCDGRCMWGVCACGKICVKKEPPSCECIEKGTAMEDGARSPLHEREEETLLFFFFFSSQGTSANLLQLEQDTHKKILFHRNRVGRNLWPRCINGDKTGATAKSSFQDLKLSVCQINQHSREFCPQFHYQGNKRPTLVCFSIFIVERLNTEMWNEWPNISHSQEMEKLSFEPR